MDINEFKLEWLKATENHNDRLLYTLVLRIFKEIIPGSKDSSRSNEFNEFISFLSQNIESILELNYEKSSQLRQVLTDVYKAAFQVTSKSDQANLSNEVEEKSQIDFDNEPLKDILGEPLLPEDAKGSEFFKIKIREQFEQNIQNLFDLIRIGHLKERKSLMLVLNHLITIFGDAPEQIISPLLNYFQKGFIQREEFIALLEKCLDKDPSPIIFAVVTELQELMLSESIESKIINQIEIIMSVFAKYAEFYPDYFVGHINLYVGLIGKFSDNLTISACNILLNYAKIGDEALNELFFDIYAKVSSLNPQTQPKLVEVLRELLSIDAPFILENIYKEKLEFNKTLVKQVKDNMKSPYRDLQEVSFEIAIQMWKYEVQIDLMPNEGGRPSISKILKPIKKILQDMHDIHLNSPYVLLQATRDIDQIINELNPNAPPNKIENEIMNTKNIENESSFFPLLNSVIKTIEKIS